MKRDRFWLARVSASVALLQLATSCSDRELPSGPGDRPAPAARAVSCQADVRAQMLTCTAPPAPSSGTGSSKISADMILGGQGTYVQLSSSNVSYDAGTQIFQADVTVQNLTALLLGTPDGSTVTGVKVFFYSGPSVVAGTGTVTVANADGMGTFTGTNQAYFAYDQILQTAEVSSAKTWRWAVPSTVSTFTFQMLVDAAAPGQIHVLSLSSASSLPMSLLSMTVLDLDPTAEVAVRFFNDDGFLLDIPAIDVSVHSLVVSVPPFTDPSTGSFVAGIVNVQVIQQSGTSTLASNIVTGFHIEDLPFPAVPGMVTESFLAATIGLANQLPTVIRGTIFDTPAVTADIRNQLSNLITLDGEVQALIRNPSSDFTLGSMEGTLVTVRMSDLETSDRLILGILLAQGSSQGAVTSVFSRGDRRALAANGGACAGHEAQAYTDALLHDPASASSAATAYANAFLNCGPDAFNRAYQVVGGAGGVAVGAVALLGIPTGAAALPGAALAYVTVVGGSGMIAIGGASTQQTAADVEYVRGGVEKLQDLLLAPLKSIPIVGSIAAFVVGAKALNDAFASAPGGLTTQSYSGTFTAQFTTTRSSATINCSWTTTFSNNLVDLTLTQQLDQTVSGIVHVTGAWSAVSADPTTCFNSSDNIDASATVSGTASSIVWQTVLLTPPSGNVYTGTFTGALSAGVITGTLNITYGGFDGSGATSVEIVLQ